MAEANLSAFDQLQALLNEGKITAEDYETLLKALETQNKPAPQPPAAPARPRLRKSWTDRQLGGVCAGIAESLGSDPWIVRALFIFAFFATHGGALVAYLLLYFVMPWTNDRDEVLTVSKLLRNSSRSFPVLLLVLWGGFFLCNLYLLPKFEALYRSLGAALPGLNLVVLHLFNTVAGWVGQGVGFVALIAVHRMLAHYPKARRIYERIVIFTLILILAALVIYPLVVLPKMIR